MLASTIVRKAHVAYGVALLDAKLGRDWVTQIDLYILDVGHGQDCVLGQLNRKGMLGATGVQTPYYAACRALFPGHDQSYEHPLAVAAGFTTNEEWELLNEEWHAVIKARLIELEAEKATLEAQSLQLQLTEA